MPEPQQPDDRFQTTRWSLVRRAAVDGATPEASAAMADFCRHYRKPLLAFARATVRNPEDAEDLVQGFFLKLLEKNFIAGADPERGRLRTFLLTCMKRHMADEFRKAHAGKRGGHLPHLPLDEAEVLQSSAPSPDDIFHRKWAAQVVDSALDSMRAKWGEDGKAEIFDALKPLLGFGSDTEETRATLAESLNMTTGALKTALYRMRKEFREFLMSEVAETLEEKTPDNVLAEMRELMAWA